jgi:transposase InsO family protein
MLMFVVGHQEEDFTNYISVELIVRGAFGNVHLARKKPVGGSHYGEKFFALQRRSQDGPRRRQILSITEASIKSEYFIDEEGLIFRRRKNGEHQFVVPVSLTQKVIEMNHEPVTVAHPGMSRTLDYLCLRFYWLGMHRRVEEYVKNCHACQRFKPRHEFKAHLGVVMEPTLPWEVVAIDICGPFPTTPNNNRYLLTFLDHLTKYAEAIPITLMTAEERARAYATHVIARHGACSKLLNDQGRNFKSAFFRETCKILGVKQLYTTAYHPQANGILERWHRSLCEGL